MRQRHYFWVMNDEDIIGLICVTNVPHDAPVEELENSGDFGNKFTEIVSLIFDATAYRYMGTKVGVDVMSKHRKSTVTIPWALVVDQPPLPQVSVISTNHGSGQSAAVSNGNIIQLS